jgi:hypothetical protein
VDARAVLLRFIEMAGGSNERGYVLALMNDGLRDPPATLESRACIYSVVQPRTELGLRHLLWKAQGAPLLALLDDALARKLPADLVRGAQRECIHAIEPAELLHLVLRVPVVGVEDVELQNLALDHAAALRGLLELRTLPTMIDGELLDELLVDALVGSRLRRDKPGQILANWLREPPTWSPPIRKLLERQLPRLHGLEGTLLAVGLAKPSLLRQLLVRGVLLTSDKKSLPPAVWGDLVELPQRLQLTDETFRRALVTLVGQALDALGSEAKPYLVEAEKLARSLLTAEDLKASNDLPLGLENLCVEVAMHASSGVAVEHARIERLRGHRFASARAAEIDVLEEMARLSRWLAQPEALGGGVRELAHRYQHSGAFADWAAQRLQTRIASSAAFAGQAEQLLQRYRDRRDRENLAFAELLRQDYVAALHRSDCVPLHQVWTSPPVQPAQGAAGRLYVIVLDGCSYPVFLRLVSELAVEHNLVGLRWATDAQRALVTPALAPLPTITSHARGAIFLGEIPRDPWIAETRWRDETETTTDPARFRQNAALKGRTHQLFLKGDLTDHGQALVATLQASTVEVVAVVFNAIDDQIGSSNTGAKLQVHANAIAGFIPSIRAALAGQRRIIVTADHGHSPFWGKALRVGEGASARYRELGASEQAPAGFIEIDVDRLGGKRGRMAFAWKMGAYQGGPQVGFHGGCSLEEMVVPLAELVADGVAADEPNWWYAVPTPAAEQPAAAPFSPSPAPVTPPPRAQQGDLYQRREDLHAPRLERLGLPPALQEKLDTSERAALAIVHENRSARVSDIARSLGRAPPRVAGLMSRLVSKLHAGGFPCLKRQTLADGEDLYEYVPQGTELP